MQSKGLRGVFLSLIEMLRLTISRVDSFYSGIVAMVEFPAFTPQSLILGPAQRKASDDVMVSLSVNYITGNCL